MTCYHPLTAYRSLNEFTENGKSVIRFTPGPFLDWEEIKLPCGQCIGCRLERSRQWAVRSVHEALQYESNCFITLTYSDEFLHPSGSLKFCKKDFQLFMKRLRKQNYPGIRFIHCGEYGSTFQRPHHHAILFNYDFSDKYFWKCTKLGFPLFRSPELERLWPFGHSTVGACTFETVAYVARYVTKKVNGELADAHYYGRSPEYITMSRRPGIGYKYLIDHPEIYNYDEIVIRDKIKCRPPSYYDRKFEEIAPEFMDYIKKKRKYQAMINPIDPECLCRKEEFKLLSAAKLKRCYEEGN